MSSLFKVVFVIALLACAIVEIGSPVWTKTAVSVAATNAASAGSHDYFSSHDPDTSRQAASDAAVTSGAKLDSFNITPDGTIHVTVDRMARSYVLYRISLLKKWYDVKASSSATPA